MEHEVYKEWKEAVNTVDNACRDLSEATAKLDVIESKLEACNLEPIVHDLQDQRQQAFDAVNNSQHQYDTLIGRAESTSSERQAVYAELSQAKTELEAIEAKVRGLGGKPAPLTEAGSTKRKRSVLGEEEKFEAKTFQRQTFAMVTRQPGIGHVHELYKEWKQAMNVLGNVTLQYYTVFSSSASNVIRDSAYENLRRMQSKFKDINSQLKAFNLEPISHDVQDQRQKAFDAVNNAQRLHDTLIGRVDSTSSERQTAFADLLTARKILQVIENLGGELAPLTETGSRKRKRFVVSEEEEKFEALWTKLSPHANPNAQEQNRKVFRKEKDLDVCDMSTIHAEFESLFAVRDQYRKLDNFLAEFLDPDKKDEMNLQRRTYTILTGQPGIGKSVFMLWLLCKRIAAGEPTAWQSQGMLYLFGCHEHPGGPLQFLSVPVDEGGRYKTFLSMPTTWNLVDAEPVTSNRDMSYNSPCPALVGHPSSAPGANVHWPIIIFCSSHQIRRFRRWSRDRSGVHYYMEPWSLQEVLNCKEIGLFSPLSKDELIRRFDEVNGCIQQLIASEKVWTAYHADLEQSLNALSDEKAISRAIQDQHNRDNLSASNVFYVLPLSEENQEDYRIQPGSKYIQEMLYQRFKTLRSEQRQEFWHLKYHDVFSCRSWSGSIYESFFHINFNNLTLISHGTNCTPLMLPTEEAQTCSLGEDTGSLADTTTWYIRPDTSKFPTIDSILLTKDKKVFLLQITLASQHSVNEKELNELWKRLPSWTKNNVPWFFCFIGGEQEALKKICTKPDIKSDTWKNRLQFRWIHVPYEDTVKS